MFKFNIFRVQGDNTVINNDKTLKEGKPKILRRVGTVISIVLICVLGYFFIIPNSYSNEELFEEYYQFPGKIILKKSIDESFAGKFYIAINKMESQNYQEALPYFKDLLKTQDVNVIWLQAQWYYGLCLLKTNGSEDEIRAVFSDIIKNKSPYTGKAIEIINKKYSE